MRWWLWFCSFFLHSGFENDGGVKSEGGPAPADCGQDNTSGEKKWSLILKVATRDHS